MDAKLRLLGQLEVEKADTSLRTFRSRKAGALLGFLARQPEPVSRQSLATLFWPDHEEARGRRNLSRELSDLATLLPGCFETNYETVWFRAQCCWLDTAVFEALVDELNGRAGITYTPGDLIRLDQAVALYRGDFMQGQYLAGCAEFETWLLREQEHWRQQVTRLLESLIIYHTMRQQDDEAQRYARRWLSLEPWREEAHCYLMALLARSGQQGAALSQYQHCRQILAKELEVKPAAATTALYEAIRAENVEALNTWLAYRPAEGARLAIANLLACPYRGLVAFTEADARFFFGRERFTTRLAELVRQQALVAVIGPSGSGKSSAVFAGLLPLLKDEGGTPVTARGQVMKAETSASALIRHSSFVILSFRPGSRPFIALAAALLPLLQPQPLAADPFEAIEQLAEGLSGQTLDLADVIGTILAGQPQADRLLLVIDQFEELYSLCPKPDIRQHFIDMLLAAISPAEPPARLALHLVITLRADFMEQALGHRPLAEAIQPGMLLLGPMSPSELRRAIEEPAQQQGIAFEAGLVERLLQDVAAEPGQLPLLEFALTALWQQPVEANHLITHQAYEAIGRVEGALTRYAEQVYEQLAPAEQGQAQALFSQLVQPGERTGDIRRVATRQELGQANWALAQKLAKSRLLVIGRDGAGQETVEVAHEALLRIWGRLQEWLGQDRGFRVWQEQLRLALRQWQASGRDEAALWRGLLLAEAETWLQNRADGLGPEERSFIEISLALRQREQEETKAKRRREVQKLASWWKRIVQLQETEAHYRRDLAQAQGSFSVASQQVEQAQQQLETLRVINGRQRWFMVGVGLVSLIVVVAGFTWFK